jgi:2-C-methyl-D-erythritol 4-phosphate cytidylyltransferase
MKLAVIVPAAGASQRYREAAKRAGVELPRSKLDEDLGGRPVLQRTVELFANLMIEGVEVGPIIVAGPADAEELAAFKARYGDKLGLLGCTLCAGGKDHRWETVRNALALVPASATHVAVHDAARPCASVELIERVLAAAAKHPAVIPAVDVSDTIKRVHPEPIKDDSVDPLAAIFGADAGGAAASRGPVLRAVRETVERVNLVAVQTPQVFEAGLLRRAYAQGDLSGTDDAQLVERLGVGGVSVVVVPGDVRNLKITRPEDLVVARSVLGVKAPEAKAAHLRF